MIRFIFGFLLLFSLVLGDAKKNDIISQSLIQIKVTTQPPNFQFPWVPKKPNVNEIVGIYVGKERILVLAASVEYATSIEIRKHSTHTMEPAKIKKMDFEANLALLTVSNKSFFEDLKPASFEDKLDPNKEVILSQLDNSGTTQNAKGRINGIDMDSYPLSHIELPYLNITTNEKIEGNGELISSEGKLLGILYKFFNNKNSGKAIPGFIINQFLEHDKKGSAFPYMGFRYRPIIDKSTKDYYGLTKEGVLVAEITPYSGAAQVLQLEDVILEAGNFTLDAHGFFQHPDLQYGKQSLSFLLNAGKEIGYKKGDRIKLKILRDKKEIFVNLPLKSFPYKSIAIPHMHIFGRNPNYTIIGGFIFTELTEFLLKEWGGNWRSKVDKKLLYLLDYKKFHAQKQSGKILILVQVLPDDSNNGYHNLGMEIIKSVNGKPVKSLKEMEKLLVNSREEIASVELENGVTLAIDVQNMDKINEKISKKFNIPQLSSVK